jgi:hypothetical protein
LIRSQLNLWRYTATNTSDRMHSPRKVALVALGLAACGAFMGAACAIIAVAAALITHSPRPILSGFAPPPLLVAVGAAGAAIGAVSAPILAFAVLRRVALGRAIVVTAIGTIVGAAAGEAIAPLNPYDADRSPGIVRGALIGFVAAGVVLRLTATRARRSQSVDPAV